MVERIASMREVSEGVRSDIIITVKLSNPVTSQTCIFRSICINQPAMVVPTV